MRAFASLLERLAFTPARNAKLRLLRHYLEQTPDPDRGYALAALTGDLKLRTVTPGLLRGLMVERVDEQLFALSYDFVGDLAETIALLLPESQHASEQGLAWWLEEQLLPLRGLPPAELAERLPPLWAQLDRQSLMVSL